MINKRQEEFKKRQQSLRKGQLILLFFILFVLFSIFLLSNRPLISDLSIQEQGQQLMVSFKSDSSLQWYCNQGRNKESLQSTSWKPAQENSCLFTVDKENDRYFIANPSGNIIEVGASDNLSFTAVFFTQEVLELRLGQSAEFSFNTVVLGDSYPLITYEYDDSAIELDPLNRTIKALKPGNYSLIIQYGTASDILYIEISNLLVSRDYLQKDKLSNYQFSKEENDYLDEQLSQQILQAGYHTRAGVVEAARFLTLDFAFEVPYFFENGRLPNKVDGEGRYYHEGLYLNDSRYQNIAFSLRGPAVWGEKLYSNQTRFQSANGLNCSGFVTWALVNGGYDPGDIGAQKGAGGWLCDLGTKLKPDMKNLDAIKVGDIVHSVEVGGHVGLIIAKDEQNFYIAEALWYGPKCVTVTALSYQQFIKRFDIVVLMDDFYQADGQLSDNW